MQKPEVLLCDMLNSKLFEAICKRMDKDAKKAASLILDVNSNLCEQVNAVICQKIGGKMFIKSQ